MITPALISAIDAGLMSVSLFRTADGWQANVKARGSEGFRVAIQSDPVAALLEALTGQRTPASTSSESVFD